MVSDDDRRLAENPPDQSEARVTLYRATEPIAQALTKIAGNWNQIHEEAYPVWRQANEKLLSAARSIRETALEQQRLIGQSATRIVQMLTDPDLLELLSGPPGKPGKQIDFLYIQHRIITATGWTPEYIDQMSLADVMELFKYWRDTPPPHESQAELIRRIDPLVHAVSSLELTLSNTFSTITPGVKRRGRPPSPPAAERLAKTPRGDPTVQRIKQEVRRLKGEGLDYKSICARLGGYDRPPRATWRHLSWPVAYRMHTSAVNKWICEALS